MFDDEAIEKEHVESLNKMNLHGNFFRARAAIPEVNTTESNQWLETAHLRFETESLICAAQEQALATNNIKAKVWKTEKYSPKRSPILLRDVNTWRLTNISFVMTK